VEPLYHAPHEGKRRWRRHKADAPLRILAHSASQKLVLDGRCLQLSDGGMCFFALGNFAPGTQVHLEFVNPETGETHFVRGTIRSRSVYLYGVEYEASRTDA